MYRNTWLVALFAALFAFGGGLAMAETKTVSGTVTYLDRSLLRPGSVLDVELVDVSLADAPSVLLAARRFAIDKVPFGFDLAYDATLIDDRSIYAIQARISRDGRVIYRSTTRNPVLTGGAPEMIDITLDLMPVPASQGLEGSNWEASELAGRMLVTEKRPSIGFLPEARVAIVGGCNRLSGPVEISGSSIRFSDRMAGTLMACPPPYDRLERDFLEALGQVTGFVRTGSQLALTNAAGVTVLRLTRAD